MRNRIQEQRQAKGWSMQRLADAVGTTKSQIFKLERGDRRLTVEWMEIIARALDCLPADLLPPEDAMPPGGSLAVPVRYAVAAMLGGQVQALSPEARYHVQVKLPPAMRGRALTAMRMEGEASDRFPEGSELIFAALAGPEDLAHGRYVLVEETVQGHTVQYIGQLEVTPRMISIQFRGRHPRHHHTLLYWQDKESEWLQEADGEPPALPEIPASHGNLRILGVLAKSIRNELDPR